MATAAWTRKEGKSKSGGLNAKGRASYKGGTLKAPTKSKTSSRRKSGCGVESLSPKSIHVDQKKDMVSS